jgi:hypothetical protein
MQKKLFLLLVVFFIVNLILFAEESYPDYYNRVIKPTAIYSVTQTDPTIKNKKLNVEIGLYYSYNFLFANKYNDVDPASAFGFIVKKNYSKFDYLQFNIYYKEFTGILHNNKIANKLLSLESIYMIKPPIWSLPVFIGGGIGLVYNDPDYTFKKTDKSGIFALLSTTYKLSQQANIFLNIYKSSLNPDDFKEGTALGFNFFLY